MRGLSSGFMRLALLLVLAALTVHAGPPAAPKALPLNFSSPAKGDTYTVGQISEGNASITVWNSGSELLQVQAELTLFYLDSSIAEKGASPSVQPTVVPASSRIEAGASAVYTLSLGNIPSGSYTGFLILKDTTGHLAPVTDQIRIVSATPEPMVSKLTVILTRRFPFSDSYCSRVFKPPFRTGYAGQTGRPVGGIANDQGGWTSVKWQSPSVLEIAAPPTAGKYTGDLTFGAAPAKVTLTLTVLVQDCWFWPFCTILGGITMAFVVKRYLGRERVILTLREQAADSVGRYRAADRAFGMAAAGSAFREYSISDDLETHIAAIQKALDRLSHSWSTNIDSKDDDYQAAIGGLKQIDDAVAIWARFGTNLKQLAASVQRVTSAARSALVFPPSVSSGPPSLVKAAEKLLEPAEKEPAEKQLDQAPRCQIKFTDLNDRSQSVADLMAVAQAWPDVVRNLSEVTSEFQGLDLPENRSTDQDAKLKAFQEELDGTWRSLFEVQTSTDLDAVTVMGGPISDVRAKLDQLEIALAQVPGGPQAKRLELAAPPTPPPASALPAPVPADDLTGSPTHKAEFFRSEIAAGDLGSILFAILIAVLTGMNVYYFGKPFGTLQDYVGLFLWAAGTKAALDILAAVADQLTKLSAAKGS
jgi:hypothetical protein